MAVVLRAQLDVLTPCAFVRWLRSFRVVPALASSLVLTVAVAIRDFITFLGVEAVQLRVPGSMLRGGLRVLVGVLGGESPPACPRSVTLPGKHPAESCSACSPCVWLAGVSSLLGQRGWDNRPVRFRPRLGATFALLLLLLFLAFLSWSSGAAGWVHAMISLKASWGRSSHPCPPYP